MKRRDFLKAGLAGGAAALLGPKGTPGTNPSATTGQVKEFEFDEATIGTLRSALKEGRETARSLAEKYLARIEEIDKKGPALSSVIAVDPDALAAADALDKGPLRGPLHGILVLIKDNIGMAGKLPTTAGSLALAENFGGDAHLVSRLRKAGAVILGKTNLSEWANFRSTHSSSGWSAVGGQCKNPYALDRNPCGSSSGSGAATAANLCCVSVGTETDGSIVCPSTTNGLVGIKPTLGLISGHGIVPLSHSQDTAGPMCRTVTDAAILLGVLAGSGEEGNLYARGGYERFLKKDGLKGARIGIARKFFGFSDKVDKVMHEAILAIKEAGAVIVDPADLPSHGQYDDTEFEVLLYDFKADINKYLAARKLECKSLADLIKFNERNKVREMPHFGQEIFHMAQAKGPLSEKKYKDALAKNHLKSCKEGIDAVMNKHKLDAIIAPTGGPAWTTDLVNGDHFSGGSSTPSAVSGYPAITVPAGMVRGLPVGITFFGRAWSEGTLIKLAYAFEQETKARKPPRFLNRAELD